MDWGALVVGRALFSNRSSESKSSSVDRNIRPACVRRSSLDLAGLLLFAGWFLSAFFGLATCFEDAPFFPLASQRRVPKTLSQGEFRFASYLQLPMKSVWPWKQDGTQN